MNYQQQQPQMPYQYGMMQQPGMMYNQAIPQPKYTNPLSSQRISELRNRGTAFSLALTQDDIDRAICTHRDPVTHQPTLIQNGDGSVTCTICGYTFQPIESGIKDIEDACNLVTDVLQTIKTMYLDIPENVCREFFQIIPYIQKAPKLFEIAAKNLKQYEGVNPLNQTGGMNGFNLFGMLTGPGMMAPQQMGGYQPYAQYDPYQQQQQAAMMGAYQQPMAPGYPGYPQGNAFGYNMPQQPQVQQQVPVQQQMSQQQPTGTPDQAATTTKVFNV